MIQQTFNRQTIVAFSGHTSGRQISHPTVGERGWAHYPEGFFGCWEPANNTARRSMQRPKRVTYLPLIGWTFDIELRMIETQRSLRPVGFVYRTQDGAIGASNIRGATGFLATTSSKRVKVVHR